MNIKFSYDINGNKIVKFTPDNGSRGFSIQTLGNMPESHRMDCNDFDRDVVLKEMASHVIKYGTTYQKELIGHYTEPYEFGVVRDGC